MLTVHLRYKRATARGRLLVFSERSCPILNEPVTNETAIGLIFEAQIVPQDLLESWLELMVSHDTKVCYGVANSRLNQVGLAFVLETEKRVPPHSEQSPGPDALLGFQSSYAPCLFDVSSHHVEGRCVSEIRPGLP
jgi:hypothetical protein